MNKEQEAINLLASQLLNLTVNAEVNPQSMVFAMGIAAKGIVEVIQSDLNTQALHSRMKEILIAGYDQTVKPVNIFDIIGMKKRG